MDRGFRKGFTLSELLVVIAVVALLAAMLFPVFAQAREKARQTVCISHLKQLAAAMLLYSEDYDQLFPPVLALQPDEPRIFPMTWMARLEPYLRNEAVFICPSSGHLCTDWQTSRDLLQNYSFPPSRQGSRWRGHPAAAGPFGVAMWEGIGGYSGAPIGDYQRDVPSWSQGQVVRPAETILLCDHQVFDWGLLDGALYYPAPRHIREPDLALPDGSTVPEGLINAAFVDGHVRALKHERLWEILPAYSRRGGPTSDVFKYFWPYE